jgi:hypothetical protein
MASDDWTPVDEGGGSWLDTAKNVAQTTDDTVRSTANAATFGMADRFAGAMEGLTTGKGYTAGVDEQVKLSEDARKRSPYASIGGDVAGSLAVPGFGAARLAARYGGGALARALAYGGTGAATGAVQGAGTTYSGELGDYARNALIGGALGGTLGAAGGAVFGRGPATPRAAAPTSEQLHDAAQANYGALARSQAAYEPGAFARAADDVENRLLADRYHWRDSPATWRAIEEMRAGGNPGQLNTGANALVDPAAIEWVRKGINRIPQGEARATDRASGEIVKDALDDFIIRPPPGAVLPGAANAREAARATERALEARGNWAGHKRVEAVDDLITNAANTTGATHSGLNLQNELRKGVRTFVKQKGGESPASRGGFNEAEIGALTDYTRGTSATNLLRGASAAMGGGGGIGIPVASAAFGAGGGAAGQYFKDDPSLGTALGVMTPLAGMALRRAGNRRADREINEMRDMIARRTPMYNYRQMNNPGTVPGAGSPRIAKGTRDALALELMKQMRPDQQKYESW